MRVEPEMMESSVLVNSVPKFVENTSDVDGGFKTSPEQEERSAWEDLASSHPHLLEEFAGRLPAWVTTRKRRGSRDRVESDFAPEGRNRQLRDLFLEDFPTDFRQYIPSEWSQRFDSGDVEVDPQLSAQQSTPVPPKFERQQSSEKSTQTLEQGLNPNLNQYKLRNTVDLGQKTAAEIGHLDAEAARSQRSMSAPPDSRIPSHSSSGPGTSMNMGNPQQQQEPPHDEPSANSTNKQPNVRHIPIFVEGRDEPVINAHKDNTASFAESRPTPPKEEYFMEHEIPQSFHPTPHFSRAFGSPFKGFSNRNMGGFGPKIFNQTNDQQRFKQQPNHSTQAQASHPSKSQTSHPAQPPASHPPQPQASHPPQPQASHPPQSHPPTESQTHNQPKDVTDAPEPKAYQPKHQNILNDPIEKIQLIQKDVLELMSRVEVFKGTSKKDKEYIYLDEMLTRNLIKLDDIETEGKENIRLARKEAIKCIQQCIAVLEAQADNNAEAQRKKEDEVKMEQDNSNSERPQNEVAATGGASSEQESAGSSDGAPPVDVSSDGTTSDNVSQESKPMEVDANTSSQ